MGGIWLTRLQLVTMTSEVVGYKSGMALSRQELTKLMPKDVRALWRGEDEALMRLRAEEIEQIVASALHAVGNIPDDEIAPFGIRVIRKYLKTELFPVVEDLMKALPSYMDAGMKTAKSEGGKAVDPRPFFAFAEEKHGLIGAHIALELLADLNLVLHRSPWGTIRQVEWQDTVQLQELFKKESLETQYGAFFDQRFIDFLGQNFGSIDQINWRKFEGLTCEYFNREGFHVEIGPGRDDDNVDARVWPQKPSGAEPPAILVQCKRQKQKISKIVVKALWADVVHEKATSGLVVTTTALSPGAKKICTARNYPVDEADRATLKTWIDKMRTPHTGVILGE
jgi:restriction system protein